MSGAVGGGKGSKAPSAPNFSKIAKQQSELSQQNVNAQTQANRPDQQNSWGSVNWSQGPDGSWTQKTTLDADSQAALDAQQQVQRGRSELALGLMDRAGQEMSTPLDWNGLPQAGQSVGPGQVQSSVDFSGAQALGDPSAIRQSAEDAIYQRAASRLDPQWNQREEATRARLAAQGLTPGSEAYNAEMSNLGNARNDAYSSAINDAITGGGAEASRQFGMDLSARQQGVNEALQGGQFANSALGQQFGQDLQSSQYQNDLRSRALQEEMQKRGYSMDLINSALQGQQVTAPQFQQFNMAGQAQAPDLMGAAQQQYAADQQAYSQQQQGKNSTLSGLGSLAGMAGGFMLGGPLGAGIGSSLGGALGGSLGGMGGGSVGQGLGGSLSQFAGMGKIN